MSKKTLKLTAGFALVLLSLLLVITLSLDGMVKSGIERNGSELLQTRVTVDNVSISLFSGSGTIRDETGGRRRRSSRRQQGRVSVSKTGRCVPLV